MFLIILLVILMIPLVSIVLDSQLGRALASRLERGSVDPTADRRLAALEGEVDRLGREVLRLEEESTFLHKLLEEKRPPDALPPGDREN